ncbi:MAG: molybdenum ABC transporter ATP-binding protein [Verrucomicrobia bacterium]|nr:MAG: molybdenum ABC transporter ATP-binding protein [Verrucomicrobiota bacterium]
MNLVLHRVTCPLDPFTVDLDLRFEGRVTGLFGPSGAGKTTVLDLVAGLRMPSRGRIALGGRVLTDVENRVRMPTRDRRIGYVVQEDALFPHLRVEGNLLYGCPHRVDTKSDVFSFMHVVEVLELSHLLSRSVARLSGGERQRVALGRALISRPELLLLDEPLGSLDRELKSRILPYLAKVRDEFGIPMVYVTHAPEEVMALCDHVVVMNEGRLVGQGRPEDWFEPDEGWRLKGYLKVS